MGESISLNLGENEIRLTNLERVLYPEDGYCKRDLVEYYIAVFPFLLPHLVNRPLVFTRYPRGIKEKSFYQKNAPKGVPEWMNTFTWTDNEGTEKNYVLVRQVADIVFLANLACIEIHPWLSKTYRVEHPDFIVFDLDPSEANTFEELAKVAQLLLLPYDVPR